MTMMDDGGDEGDAVGATAGPGWRASTLWVGYSEADNVAQLGDRGVDDDATSRRLEVWHMLDWQAVADEDGKDASRRWRGRTRLGSEHGCEAVVSDAFDHGTNACANDGQAAQAGLM
jgi:hypothetical protein